MKPLRALIFVIAVVALAIPVGLQGSRIKALFDAPFDWQKAESTIHVSGGEIYADAEHDDLYAAIDMLADKLDRQLIKKKEKTKYHKHRSNAR